MKGACYIADFLVKHGVTDAFGIPGGVVLDLLYAMDAQEGITPHLNYHEQAAGFAALGYAQASGRLGVAYATRGPGFTNLLTPIAEAYSESLPVLFVTGHATLALNENMRVATDQELDTCKMTNTITKYACRIESPNELPAILERAFHEAMSGRKGPVMLDIATRVFASEVAGDGVDTPVNTTPKRKRFDRIAEAIRNAQKPVMLIGDGINQAGKRKEFKILTERMQIPILSSRFTHDVLCDSELYFGYVGSHGIRYANFVLSKADLIVAIGNRMHFPVSSASYKMVTDKAKIIRIDVDASEFERQIPNSETIQADLREVIDSFHALDVDFGEHKEWIDICKMLRENLKDDDVSSTVLQIETVLGRLPKNMICVADVGNNEFWLSRACVHNKYAARVLYSKSFGSLGCSIGKAIGTYYAMRKPVVCFTGDQGLQMNIQELQYIAQHRLPILIVLLNNNASGMIKDREVIKYGRCLHTTADSGYGNPDYRVLTEAYDLTYKNKVEDVAAWNSAPCLLELRTDPDETLTPSLPAGKSVKDMTPLLERNKYDYLNGL